MFAKSLEHALTGLLRDSDVSPVDPADMARRFETLRSYGRLPAGREHRATRLSSSQIAQAVLGLAPNNPGWAGHAATVLAGLMPVGGAQAAYRKAGSLLVRTPEYKGIVERFFGTLERGCVQKFQGGVARFAVSRKVCTRTGVPIHCVDDLAGAGLLSRSSTPEVELLANGSDVYTEESLLVLSRQIQSIPPTQLSSSAVILCTALKGHLNPRVWPMIITALLNHSLPVAGRRKVAELDS